MIWNIFTKTPPEDPKQLFFFADLRPSLFPEKVEVGHITTKNKKMLRVFRWRLGENVSNHVSKFQVLTRKTQRRVAILIGESRPSWPDQLVASLSLIVRGMSYRIARRHMFVSCHPYMNVVCAVMVVRLP